MFPRYSEVSATAGTNAEDSNRVPRAEKQAIAALPLQRCAKMRCRPREHYVACQSHNILVSRATLFVMIRSKWALADTRVTDPSKTKR